MASYACTVDGWRSRQSATWFPSSGFASIGSSTGGSSFVASNPSGNNKYTICIRVKTPSYAGISSISAITVNFKMYKGNTTSGTLYGSLRTTYADSGSSDTASTYRTNAVGSEASKAYASTSYGTFSFTFSGSFSTNTYYYLFLYSKSNSDMFFTTASNLSPSATCTYTAKTYTISYNANGGSGTISSTTKTYGTNATITTSKPTPPASSSTTSTSNFTITGNGNGGYFGSTTTLTTSITATASTPKTTSYTFKNWNTNSDGSGTSYASGATYTTEASDTLYAIYSSSTTSGTTTYSNNAISGLTKPTRDNSTATGFTVSFDANDGVLETTSTTATDTVVYSFVGWGTASTSTTANASSTYNSATTVYAVWSSTTTKGSITLPTPTKEGYIFLGWSTTADAETADIGTGTYTPSGDITLYAVWGMNNSLIYYNDNGTAVLCKVYYNDNGTAVICNVYYNDNGTAIRI